jgi:hypothetical protein
MNYYKSSKCIFCFNQISYTIALQIANNSQERTIIVVSRNRVQYGPVKNGLVFDYSVWLAAAIFLISTITNKLEIVIPHAKGGRLLRWIEKASKSLSYIDDGMDSFRDQPKNIDIGRLRHGSPYYSFDYKIPIANWAAQLRVIRVGPLSMLANDERPVLQLNAYQCLIVESPGVELEQRAYKYDAIFVARHPNSSKQKAFDKRVVSSGDAVYSLEKTLLQYPGAIVVGESMALVFVLCYLKDLSRVHVSLHREQFENLSVLHPLLAQCAGGVSFAKEPSQ